MNTYLTDTLYAGLNTKPKAFCFDEQVVAVFPDMIERSVPGYGVILDRLAQLTRQFARPNSHYYDLGCSLGAASLSMRRHIDCVNSTLIAVDNSPSMLARCKAHLNAFKHPTPVRYLLDDITETPIDNAAIVVLNFTLQFVDKAHRQALIDAIYQGLKPGGLLFVSEKLVFEDSLIDELFINQHHEFKKANGYSELEISQKRTALESVLIPETYATHCARFKKAGFKHTSLWYQQLNFGSMLAIKS